MEFKTLTKATIEPHSIKTKTDLINLTTDLKLSGLRNNVATANQAIKIVYGLENAKLNTFVGWKSEGKSVKKGAKSYTFWSGKKSFTKQENDTEKEFKFFSIAKLFAESEVEDIKVGDK